MSNQDPSSPSPQVMVNGMPGNMGKTVGQAVIRRGHLLVPFSLTGEIIPDKTCAVEDVNVELLKPSVRDAAMEKILEKYPRMVAVDYTQPDVVNENAEFYIKWGIPFVMGTTGGDRARLLKSVKDANLYAIIAPNMGKQIVAFQAMMEYMAKAFPGAFEGYTLRVTESHQKMKKDTSGTAKAVIASFNKLGVPFDVDAIEMVREPEDQLQMGVPAEYLLGHAYHTYHLDSADGTVSFEFQHNVRGRNVYAEGTVDAVEFLASKVAEHSEKKLFDMIDVLQQGSMS